MDKLTEVTIKLSDAEMSALKALAQKSKRTLEESVTRAVLIELVKANLLKESTERNGWVYTRLDE